MLNVDCSISLQLKIVLEGVLDGDHEEEVIGDYKDSFGWSRGGFRKLNFPTALWRHHVRSTTRYFLLFFDLRLLSEILTTLVRLFFRYKNDLL